MKKYLKYLALLILISAAVAYKVYHKPHKNIIKANVDIEINAIELFSAYEQDEAQANNRFLDKIIQVTGTVKEVNEEENGMLSLVLETGDALFGIICQFDAMTKHGRTTFEIGESVKLKGLCTGKLLDVVMVRCVEI